VQSRHALFGEAPAPLAERGHTPAQAQRDRTVALAAVHSTSLARAIIAWGSAREAARLANCACSSALNTSSALGRPIAIDISP